MPTVAGTSRGVRPGPQDCSAAGNVTRSLLGYLALAGPFYVAVSLAQEPDPARLRSVPRRVEPARARAPGLDPAGQPRPDRPDGHCRCHRGATGYRWLRRRRYLGAAAARGLWYRAHRRGHLSCRCGTGFPPGTPGGRAVHVSGHGMLHLLSGSIGFVCLVAACFVIARSYRMRADRRAAVVSGAVGVVFAAGFAGIATGHGGEAINLGFTAAVVISSAWLTTVAVDLYRRTRADAGRGNRQGADRLLANQAGGMADQMNAIRKVVISSTLDKADWQNTAAASPRTPAGRAAPVRLPGRYGRRRSPVRGGNRARRPGVCRLYSPRRQRRR